MLKKTATRAVSDGAHLRECAEMLYHAEHPMLTIQITTYMVDTSRIWCYFERFLPDVDDSAECMDHVDRATMALFMAEALDDGTFDAEWLAESVFPPKHVA